MFRGCYSPTFPVEMRYSAIHVCAPQGSIGRKGQGAYIYRSSKAAVNMVATLAATELAGRGVMSIPVHPGWVRTDMGGPNADHDVTSVLPGALVPALLEDHGPSGQRFCAQDFAGRE